MGTKKPRAIICDIDGTLANIDHRRIYFDEKPKNWKAFNENMHLDTVNEWVKRFLYYRGVCIQLIFVTGRMRDSEDVTRSWLAGALDYGDNYKLFMRERQDFRDDAIIKREIYENLIEPNYDIELVIDDRSKVVKMWREAGLECWQVAEGNY